MESKIKIILEKIDALEESLRKEHQRLAKKYGFLIEKKKVIFSKLTRERNRKFRLPAWRYVIPRRIRHVLSLPFIYSMIIPALTLDLFITIYHAVAFPLYGIPKIKRSDYIIYDRRFLDYLNVIQKVHCLYCSYVNGIFAYSLEVAARTERYWCPVKAAHKTKFHHGWYKDFADYGSPEGWNEKFNDPKAFAELVKSVGDGGEKAEK